MNSNTNKPIFQGKKILLVSEEPDTIQRFQETLSPYGAIVFLGTNPKETLYHLMSKNPELIIYDDQMPSWNGTKLLTVIRRNKPKIRVLLLVPMGVPRRSIDVSAQGASFSIPKSSSSQQIYDAVKHTLSIATVPRVEAVNQ